MTTVNGLRVLVVEDEAPIAMMIEDMLLDMGCVVAGSAASMQAAQQRVDAAGFDFALLDMNLGGKSADGLADVLAEKGIPFAFASGYGKAGLSDRHRHRPIIQKPFVSRDLEKIMAEHSRAG